MSASSRKSIAFRPRSTAAGQYGPNEDENLSVSGGGKIGALMEGNSDVGLARRGLSYRPNASNSTMQTLEKLIRR